MIANKVSGMKNSGCVRLPISCGRVFIKGWIAWRNQGAFLRKGEEKVARILGRTLKPIGVIKGAGTNPGDLGAALKGEKELGAASVTKMQADPASTTLRSVSVDLGFTATDSEGGGVKNRFDERRATGRSLTETTMANVDPQWFRAHLIAQVTA